MRSTGPRSDRQTKGEGRLWLALADLLDSPPLGSSPPRGRGNFRPVKRQLKGRLALMNEPTTLPSEHLLRLGKLQLGLCVAEEYFKSARRLENSRTERVRTTRINKDEALRSLAHHHCGMGLELSFKVFYAAECVSDGVDEFDLRKTQHRLVSAYKRINEHRQPLQQLFERHCAGHLAPVAACIGGERPPWVEGASLDNLHDLCSYVDHLGEWSTARYNIWQEPGKWMYRLEPLSPVVDFGMAAINLANQVLDRLPLIKFTLVKPGDQPTHIGGTVWSQVNVTRDSRPRPNWNVQFFVERLDLEGGEPEQ